MIKGDNAFSKLPTLMRLAVFLHFLEQHENAI